MGNLSFLSNAEPAFIDQLYQQYLQDPASVEYGWQKFFEGFDFARTTYGENEGGLGNVKEIYVLNLIQAYRNRGHLFTHTNPVRDRRKYEPSLALANFGLVDSDLETVFQAGVDVGLGPAKLKDIVALLETTYCQSIGVEYTYMKDVATVEWLKKKMESSRNIPQFALDEKKHILHKLNQAVCFENFLHTKYVGQKRFSLEGSESLIPALDAVIETGAELGADEFILGMAHRGRLNVLANILNKTYEDIFSEFEENIAISDSFDGDVKYHHGHATDVKTEKGKTIHLSLCPNPSHLEAVAPVAIGKARAKIDIKYNRETQKCCAILIHGDASIAGQGVVYEVTQMSELEAYQTGGSIHIVVNNQVGFTTNYLDARSSTYCTDVAKVTQSPVFHVNGDDAEAVVLACRIAMEFRQTFGKDVFIDLLGYRRWGHNEGDEPRFTQPTLYKLIEKHPDPREIYFQKLLASGAVGPDLAKEMEKSFKKMLQDRLNQVKQHPKAVTYNFIHSGWKDLRVDEPADWVSSPVTGVPEKTLRPLAQKMATLPAGMTFFEKAVKIFEQRRDMLEKTDKLDWAMGELMAYASLLAEGKGIRFSGQDVERGTFAHRHAVLKINESDQEFIPLNNLGLKSQGRLDIFNSLLSEYAVLGFEYGYSWSAPYHLVLWEAQFGDFANGAQIMFDQFISSAKSKWSRLSGLAVLLPHGYEGQGPEHSSARIERFLELCAGNNMQVVVPTTPAQMFHLLRRQLHRDIRVPLIAFTPKALLRHPEAVSSFAEFTKGGFQEVIDDAKATPKSVKRVIFTYGKIYYDLLKKQQEDGRKDVAIVRLEQLYPLPTQQIEAIFAKYKNATDWMWVQDEPENMGAWSFILRKLRNIPFQWVSRKEAASPASGTKKQHLVQAADLLARAFGESPAAPSKSKELVSKA